MDNVNFFFAIFDLSRKSALLDGLMIFGADYLIYFAYFLAISSTIVGTIKERKAFILTLISLIISLILIKIIRLFYLEPRPFVTYPISPLINQAADPSFPSTHTALAATLAFAFSNYKSRFAPLLLLSLVWIGFARIFVGVHYPMDILGGALVGFVSVTLVWQIKDWLKRRFLS